MRIEFLDFELDPERFLLLRGGERVALRPKVFDLLIHLVEHRDRVVPRRELMQVVWGNAVVGPGSLSGLVNELRRALGESVATRSDRAHEAILRTVHARGYQFVAAVRAGSGAESKGKDRTARFDCAREEPPLASELGPRPAVHPEAFERIRGRLVRVASGEDSGLRLEGPPGSGKTQLLEAAADWAKRAGFRVVRLDAALELDPPFGLEAGGTGRTADDPADRAASGEAEADAEWMNAFTNRVGESLVDGEPASVAPAASTLTGIARFQEESRQLRGLAGSLRMRQETRPVLLAIDGLRGGDAGERAMGWLSRLLAATADARVGVLVTSRQMLRAGHGLGGRGRFEVIRLGAIPAEGLAELFRAAALPALPRPLAEALLEYAAQPLAPVASVGHWMRAHRAEAEEGDRASAAAMAKTNVSETGPASLPLEEGDSQLLFPDKEIPAPNRRVRRVRPPAGSSSAQERSRASGADPGR